LGVPLALRAAGRGEPPFPPIRRDTGRSLSPKGSAAFAPPNIGGVSEGRGGFAPPNIGGVSEGRGGFAALRIPHSNTIESIPACKPQSIPSILACEPS